MKRKSAGRDTPPHAHRVPLHSRLVGSILGSADEVNRLCNLCGHMWIHETGSTGYGWVH